MSGGLGQAERQMSVCSVCGKEFQPRFSFQIQERDGKSVGYCSSRCQLRAMSSREPVSCSACGRKFVVEYAYQSAVFDGRRVHFCSMDCRDVGPAKSASIRRLAVYNLKGGTGKTTTSVNLAAALAGLGLRVILVDADPQGSVAVSLGVQAKRGLYQVLVLGVAPERCVVRARENLDVILSNRALAGAEVFLASRPERHRVMRDRLAALSGYDIMVIDCSPSVGLLSQNALRCADSLLIPVSCDYLGVVGMEQALYTKNDLEKRTGHQLRLVGVLPTFHDGRLIVCRDAMNALRERVGASLLPPIRVNSRLREAPAHRQTIFEIDRRSSGAEDYLDLGRWLMESQLGRTAPPVTVHDIAPALAVSAESSQSTGARSL